MDIRKLKRKPFDVEAVQVTEENFDEVAAWCNGEVRTDDEGTYIKVKVRFPLNDRQTHAHVSDWVLSSKSGYKVYTDGALSHSFEPDEDVVTTYGDHQPLEELRATAEPAEDSRAKNIFLEESGTDNFPTVSAKDSISGKQ